MTVEKSTWPEARRGAGALLRRVGVLLIWLALAAGLAIVFLALPPFQTGIWIQSEPVGLALHAVAALAALGMALALFGGSRAAGAAIHHPFVLLPGASVCAASRWRQASISPCCRGLGHRNWARESPAISILRR
jgi:hypothetical protein